jgi:hypothetical protein
MSLFITYSEMTGFPGGIPGDYYNSFAENSGGPGGESSGGPPQTLIQSVYQGSTYSVKISFKGPNPLDPPGTENPTYVDATDVSCSTNVTPYGLSIVKTSPNSLVLSGTATNVFDNEYYAFLLKNLQVVVLPAINNEEYLSVVKYNVPDTKETSKSYSVTVTYPDVTGSIIETVNLQQYFYWNYSVSLATFSQTVSKGIK